jgi:hypothetical protein
LQLAEQGTSASNSIRPQTPSSRRSSEPLHKSISTEGSCYAGSEATTTSSSPPPRYHSTSPENQLGQEGGLHTSRGVADERRLVGPALNTLLINERAREQQEEVEQEKDKGNDEDTSSKSEHPLSLQGASVGKCRPLYENRVTLDMEAIETQQANVDLLECEADSMAPMQLDSTDSDDDDEQPHPAKRKRRSPHDGPMHKKRKLRLRPSSARQHKLHSMPHRRSPTSHYPLDQGSTVAAVSSAKGRFPLSSQAPSALQVTDTDMAPDCCNPNRLSGAALRRLTEITFRLHCPHGCFLTAVKQDRCDRQGVSFGWVVRRIASIGRRFIANISHVGKIDDLTIRPKEQYSFLTTDFNRHASSRPSFGGAIPSTIAEEGHDRVDVMHTWPQEDRTVDARAFASHRCEPLSSGDDESGLSDSDPSPASGDDGCSSESESEAVRSSTRTNVRWAGPPEQRLRTYMSSGMSRSKICEMFKDRTDGAVYQHMRKLQREEEPRGSDASANHHERKRRGCHQKQT